MVFGTSMILVSISLFSWYFEIVSIYILYNILIIIIINWKYFYLVNNYN